MFSVLYICVYMFSISAAKKFSGFVLFGDHTWNCLRTTGSVLRIMPDRAQRSIYIVRDLFTKLMPTQLYYQTYNFLMLRFHPYYVSNSKLHTISNCLFHSTKLQILISHHGDFSYVLISLKFILFTVTCILSFI